MGQRVLNNVIVGEETFLYSRQIGCRVENLKGKNLFEKCARLTSRKILRELPTNSLYHSIQYPVCLTFIKVLTNSLSPASAGRMGENKMSKMGALFLEEQEKKWEFAELEHSGGQHKTFTENCYKCAKQNLCFCGKPARETAKGIYSILCTECDYQSRNVTA